MEKRIGAMREPLTVEEMKSELSLAYKRLADHGKKPVDYDIEETALASYSQFKGKCNNCGKMGHKAVNCHSQESNNHQAPNGNGYGGGRFGNRNRNGAGGRGFSGECHYCKKIGHRMVDCGKKKADQGDSALAAVDRRNYRGHQRWGGKAPYNGQPVEGDVVLAMMKMDDSIELPNFGYSNACLATYATIYAMTTKKNTRYDTDKGNLMTNLVYDSAQDESRESESDESDSNESVSNGSESNESESNESESNESESNESNGSSFDSFFDVTPVEYMRTHPTCQRDSSEDDELPPLERLQVAIKEEPSDSDTDDEMPLLMPRRSIEHPISWDSDLDSDSDSVPEYSTYEYKNASPYNQDEDDLLNAKERPIGQEDWLNYTQEFLLLHMKMQPWKGMTMRCKWKRMSLQMKKSMSLQTKTKMRKSIAS
jgi:hypothetical protein